MELKGGPFETVAPAGARVLGAADSGQPAATEVDVMDSWMRAAPVAMTAIGRHLLLPVRGSGAAAAGKAAPRES
ncbi:hypothetical protein C3489_33115 [Streptomyces sp. Ru71]|nr:hypothetical protein C3489_33115 [Streptomyces sp. Ru71]